MPAANTAETDWAVLAARGDVGGFGADPVGDGDLADGPAGPLVVEQGLGLAPDAVAVAVELHGRDTVDGLPAAYLTDPVVALGGGRLPVRHQLFEDFDRDTGIGMPLGIAVTVGIEKDLLLVERHHRGSAVLAGNRDQDGRYLVHPGAVPVAEPPGRDGPAAFLVDDSAGQQLELFLRCMGEAFAYSLLLPEDQLGGLLGDRETSAEAVALMVGVDQDRLAVVIAVQAVPGQLADLAGTAAGVDEDLDGGADLRAGALVEPGQAVTILGHCRKVLPPRGRVLIVEPVLPEVVGADATAHAADGGITYLSDLNMLVNLGGRERSRRDFEEVATGRGCPSCPPRCWTRPPST
ncbi:methyltransferase [Streptomyces sp. YH02]|uniref:methyltransferase n=1 Tax=Streptomyces sp. YH02 TaxID=3256999 RepID=UPI003756BF31